MDASDADVVLEDVHLAYEGVPALDGLSFAVRPGEMFGVVGPDGAGKTTAIRIMLGLLTADRGDVRVLGKSPTGEAAYIKKNVGYLSQRFTLYGDLTVRENMEFFGEIHRVPDIPDRLPALLEFTRLGPYQGRRADRLSGGMQKKLALACTLVHRPKIVFLDEPTTGVDPVSRREFWTLLHTLVRDGLTVVLTTPYLDEAERCTRVALVTAGRTLAEEEPVRLRHAAGKKMYEVICVPVRRARSAVATWARVAEVQLFGDRLHVVPRDADDDLDDLFDGLAADGVELRHKREILPSLEDVFISMVARSEGTSPEPP
jgi:ABC-2 type transport system ATP-binding protein